MKLTSQRLESFKDAFESITLLTGEEFFRALIGTIGDALQADAVWLTEFHKEQNSMTTKSFWHLGHYLDNFTYLIEATPCEQVIKSSDLVHYSDSIRDLFPDDHKMLEKFKSESYIGAPLHDAKGEVIGSIAFLHSKPIPMTDDVTLVLKIVKSRAESELYRLRRELELRNREHQLRGLINSMQDLLINLNKKGQIEMLNATAESWLGISVSTSEKKPPIAHFLAEASRTKLLMLTETLDKYNREDRYVWIPGELEMISANDDRFLVEGTLSQYKLDDDTYYTLVLRNREDRPDGDAKIKQLIHQTEHWRQELEGIKYSCQLTGESKGMKRLLQNVYMVAHTDATVLITGETGTGKELVAQHLHQTSKRKEKPLVTVNCGAIPATLIESEFFGHAKGAFTGASAERKGRFQLADGGTIFLDEIGELPLDLQVKLLRVIQEGEFEPVGSSKTIKVNVRIIAATHRNLLELCKDSKFREDLYYRLNVFPIEVPPLRERGDDVIIIANKFIEKFSIRNKIKLSRLTEVQMNLLRSHSWPGNIRELQNIIERAAILAQSGVLDLSAMLAGTAATKKTSNDFDDDERILTKEEFVEFEKRNIIKALKAANWKVSGKSGAAAILNMIPSTLSSRIGALGIKMPG
ncbi:MAG TPA: sigma 54-interacting transcriptional regulator [Chryseolinea sp.]